MLWSRWQRSSDDHLTARGGGVASQIVTKRTTANIGTPERLPLTDLNLHHKNPRQGDVDAIMGSMVANGVYNPLTVNRGTHTGRPNEVLAGNHRLKAMRRLAEQNPDDPRWQTVDVWMVDVDEDRATKILLSDNRTSDLGDYDNTALLALLDMVEGDLDGTGYDYDDLKNLTQQDIDIENELPEPGDADEDNFENSWAVVIECESEKEQTDLLNRLLEEGLNCRAIM